MAVRRATVELPVAPIVPPVPAVAVAPAAEPSVAVAVAVAVAPDPPTPSSSVATQEPRSRPSLEAPEVPARRPSRSASREKDSKEDREKTSKEAVREAAREERPRAFKRVREFWSQTERHELEERGAQTEPMRREKKEKGFAAALFGKKESAQLGSMSKS